MYANFMVKKTNKNNFLKKIIFKKSLTKGKKNKNLFIKDLKIFTIIFY